MNNELPDNCQLDINISPEMERVTVMGDADLLSRAFRNLTGNSSWRSGHRPERAEPAPAEGVEPAPADTAAETSADEKGGAPYEQ